MPLNDYPSAKPTYDFYVTVSAGKAAICNGVLIWTRKEKASTEFPKGSTTWHWYSRAPINSYLVEVSVGDYDLTERTADNGISYYEAQDDSIPAGQRQKNAAGGPYSRKGQAAFEASLVHQFDNTYASPSPFWVDAPSNPYPFVLFSGDATYGRPAAAYIALRQILGPTNFTQALEQVQRQYGGSSIDEAQLEAAFHEWMPNQSAACSSKLDQFFTQWFDTPYPSGNAARPTITGPGLDGGGFYNKRGGCTL